MAATDLIDSYSAHLRQASASQRTIGDRRRILTVLDRDMPYGLDGASADELLAWLWRDGLSLGTRETYYGAMNSFFTWACRKGMLDWNPCDEIDRPKPGNRLPRPLTDAELAHILGNAAEPYRLWMTIAAYAGARCVEISRLHRDEVTAETTTLHGKGNKRRVVGTHPVLWEAVEQLPPGQIAAHDPRYISIRSAVYFRRTMNMPGVSLHRGRHWFGGQIQMLYKDLRVTQEALGHADPRTTAGYAIVTADRIREAVSLLPRLA
jgi:integrase/recombinase XerC